MLTPDQIALLQRHITLTGNGNVVGNDNTVRVTKQTAGDYAVQIGEQTITVTVEELRHVLTVEHSQVGVIGDNAHVEGGINFINVVTNAVTSPRFIKWAALAALMLLSIIAFANLPGAREQLPAWLQPRDFPKEREDEILIVIATFHHTEGVADTAAHDEIKRAIEHEVDSLNLRVEVAPTSLKSDDRAGAQALGDRYDASLIIWGADTGVRVSVNFYNRKQPGFDAADVQIEETARTQIAAPSEYAEFITQDLPQQLTFLALFAVGQSYYIEGAYAESARVIEKAVATLEQQPDIIQGAAEAHFLLGWLYQVALDDSEKAECTYTRAIELNPDLAGAYNNRGIIYTDMDKYAQAERDFTRTIELNPEDARAYNNRGASYCEMDKYAQAERDYTRAIELDPEYAEAYYNRGINYYAMGEYAQAERDYTRAIELDPEDAAAYLNRGANYNEMGKYAQAERDFTHALELDPDYAEAYYNRGNSYNEMDEYAQAERDYTRAIELNPEDAAAYLNRGANYNEMGEYAKAERDYTRAIELDPQDAKVYYNRGINYNAMGEYAQAERDYTYALELDPNLPEAYNNRGINYNAMGEYAQAERDFTRAIELNPEYAEAYNNRGNNYNAMGEYKAALADLEHAATLMTHPGIYYNGARAHAQLDHSEDACAWLEKAITEIPQLRDIVRTDSYFDSIRDALCFQALLEATSP